MTKTDVASGVSLVDIPSAGLSVLCGCPENAVKRLIKRGAIREIERDGKRFETGPNAILLSDTPVQGGRFRNLGEFPVLQMLYKQGMIVPGHPNNSGRRPMLIGLRDQVEAQARYIFSGNYGLSSVAELEEAGLDRGRAEELFLMKLKFAFGSVRPTEELLDLRVVDCRAIEMRDGAFIRRIGVNRYEFIAGGDSVEVDLNIDSGAASEPPYALPERPFPRDYFSVVHLGEGDGWDADRPCMSSLIVFRGEPYLVDAGPDIEASLRAVGLGPGELRGVFQTHAHDDHFVGLTALFRGERRLRYYAVPWVRASVQAKLRAIVGIDEREFRGYFDVRDLEEGRWNDLEGLEVLPTLSPHPVETTILRFRAGSGVSRRSYAHLADLSSFEVIDSMLREDPKLPGISRKFAERAKAAYLEPADVKKIDSGGGMIHGDWRDFVSDGSGRLLVSHTSSPPELPSGFRGTVAAFGEADRLLRVCAEEPPAAAWSVAETVAPAAADPRALAAFESCALFSELSSPAIASGVASSAKAARFEAGAKLCSEEGPELLLIASGRACLVAGGKRLEELGPGEVFGEEALLVEGCCIFDAVALSRVEAYRVPASALRGRPALLWRLRELLNARIASFKGAFAFAWRPEYSVRNGELDGQHRRLFALIDALDEGLSSADGCAEEDAVVAELEAFALLHFETEEKLMEAAAYPGLAEQRKEHEYLRSRLGGFRTRLSCGDEAAAAEIDGFLKDWILRHTLLVDREYIPYLAR
jgi:hemerythrin-like metal-binding protein